MPPPDGNYFGKVNKADIELQPLSAINDIFERLEKGEVPSRVVIDFTGGSQAMAAVPARNAVAA